MNNPRDPRDPRSGRGPGSMPGAPQPRPSSAQAPRPATPHPQYPPRGPSQAQPHPQPHPQAQPQAQQQRHPARPPTPIARQPDPEPEPLDLDALDLDALDLDALEPSTLPGAQGQRLDAAPAELDPDALLELDPEALYAQALAEVNTGSEAPIALDESALGELIEEAPPIDDTPLMEGFENTRLDDAFDRRAKKKPTEGPRRVRPKTDFVFTACPSCATPVPDPAPAFCESCGTRLRNPGKKGASAQNEGPERRCGECGFRNRGESGSCSNCGSRLPEAHG